jgi:hypothetical protein
VSGRLVALSVLSPVLPKTGVSICACEIGTGFVGSDTGVPYRQGSKVGGHLIRVDD